ncbi:MAG: FAD-dependent oxidoreductase [Rubellimicrobium sp.]|nr:FAD-dependent oxidoreductase [Rubellimicrobium sp.]
MADQGKPDNTPDLTEGITLADFRDRKLLRGHVGKKAVLLARVGDDIHAVGATCTHYQGRLDRGALEGDAVRCPLHHALFSLHTGEALNAPAFGPIPVWQVERDGERIFVREQKAREPAPARVPLPDEPEAIVIIGGGAAGFAAAEMLRRRGYAGKLTVLSAEEDAPVDRPNLSKDYLDGSAPDDWMPLKGAKFYEDNRIDLHLSTTVERIDTEPRQVMTTDGTRYPWDRLLIATGAEPVALPIPGADRAHVFTLRSIADSRAIMARAEAAKSAVVLGSGFIGLETAAALRKRGLDVHVVSLDAHPLERVLGPELGGFIRTLHEEAGEVFHLETSIESIGEGDVTLKDGTRLPADLVIIGVGVRPRLGLAERLGLEIERGVLVNDRLETAIPGIYAAGDIARFPGSDGDTMRVEHWVVAERQGQVAAENMLGADRPYRDVPFFWSGHHGTTIRYVGHAQGWDEIRIDGEIGKGKDCAVRYLKGGRVLAMATIFRDREAIIEAQRMAEGA